MVRSIDVKLLTENIKEMCIQANHYLAPDMDKAMKNAYEKETKPLAKQILGQYGSGVFKGRTGCTL